MAEIKMVPKRGIEQPESDVDSPAVKKLRESLSDDLDYDLEQLCDWNEDLDSFMKGFEGETTFSPSADAAGGGGEVDVATDLGESRPDLGYLLQASDEELGIPPLATLSATELVRVASESAEFGNKLGEEFAEGEIYDGEYEDLGGVFVYSDMGIGSDDCAWGPDTRPLQFP